MAKSSGISVVAFVAGDARAFVDHHVQPSGLGRGFGHERHAGAKFRDQARDRLAVSDRPRRSAPKTGPIVINRSLTVPFDGQTLQIPPGFTATPFAIGLANPRRLLVLPNGDVVVAEQSQGYLTLLRDDRQGRAIWIDRHVEDLNKPYGQTLKGDEILVADQDGIWRVPHVVGALRAGRPVPPQRADQVPPDQRKPVPGGAYGAEMLTKKGVFGIVQGHQDRPVAIVAPSMSGSARSAISGSSPSPR